MLALSCYFLNNLCIVNRRRFITCSRIRHCPITIHVYSKLTQAHAFLFLNDVFKVINCFSVFNDQLEVFGYSMNPFLGV